MEFINKKRLNKKLTKIIAVLILFVTIFMNLSKTVYAGVLSGEDWQKDFSYSYDGTGVHTSQALTTLQQNFGYEGTELAEEMKLNTTATLSKVNNPFLGIGDTTYNVTIGTGDKATTIENMSAEQVKEIFGDIPSEGSSCDVSIIASFEPANGKDYIQMIDGNNYWIGSLKFKEIYSGKDISKTDNTPNSGGDTIDVEIDSPGEVTDDFLGLTTERNGADIWDGGNTLDTFGGILFNALFAIVAAIFDAINAVLQSVMYKGEDMNGPIGTIATVVSSVLLQL